VNRHLRLLDFTLAALGRSWRKTLVIVTVYSIVIGLVSSMFLYVGALRRESRLLLSAAPDLTVQRMTAGRQGLIGVDRAEYIRGIRGVGSVTPRVWGYSFDPPSGLTLTLWGVDSIPADTLWFEDGGTWEDADGGSSCAIGRGLAEARFLAVGDRLPLKRADGTLVAPRVTGVFTAGSSILTNDLVVMRASEIRRIFAIGESQATDLAVHVGNPREVETVARKIQEAWPDVRTVSRSQVIQTYDAVFDWRGGVWAALLLSSVAAFGILVWDKASGLSAEEYRMLGILKAVGWRTRDVLELKLWEGLTVSVLSALLGLLAAHVHLVVFDGALFSRVLRGWSVVFPNIDLAPELDLRTLLLIVTVAVFPYVAATLVPSWRAAITDPDTIIRS
jgi:ABC-type lipoprotein release transport system permease subunit